MSFPFHNFEYFENPFLYELIDLTDVNFKAFNSDLLNGVLKFPNQIFSYRVFPNIAFPSHFLFFYGLIWDFPPSSFFL